MAYVGYGYTKYENTSVTKNSAEQAIFTVVQGGIARPLPHQSNFYLQHDFFIDPTSTFFIIGWVGSEIILDTGPSSETW